MSFIFSYFILLFKPVISWLDVTVGGCRRWLDAMVAAAEREWERGKFQRRGEEEGGSRNWNPK